MKQPKNICTEKEKTTQSKFCTVQQKENLKTMEWNEVIKNVWVLFLCLVGMYIEVVVLVSLKI